MKSTAVVVLLFTLGSASAFFVAPSKAFHATSKLFSSETEDVIVSPFEEGAPSDGADEGPLDLTWDNVEMVLDEMRPYLIQDGGNVAIKEIDGPVVRLELQVSLVSIVIVFQLIHRRQQDKTERQSTHQPVHTFIYIYNLTQSSFIKRVPVEHVLLRHKP